MLFYVVLKMLFDSDKNKNYKYDLLRLFGGHISDR